ncbi:MAG: dephospho-CoA kinase [Coriobacteriales bacterium]|nr:dephospho-CoA kinase [Coriobacteriales bacterium]
MHTVFLAGGIASGKSTVAREFERHGARRIDLDVVSREVCEPGSAVLDELVDVFGSDVIEPRTGELRRDVLAKRAFVTQEATQSLEAITHPAIFAALKRRLDDAARAGIRVCVVEVPLLDRALDLGWLADEIVCVVSPTALRRERAILRGMDGDDFDRRDAAQPSQDYLERHADTVFANDGDFEALMAQVGAWWENVTEER